MIRAGLCCVVLVSLVLVYAPAAHSQPTGWRASADLNVDGESIVATRLRDGEQRDGQVSVSLGLRGTVGKGPVHFGAGFSYRLGSSLPGGFLYAVELLPVGVGLVFSDRFRVVVRGGVGVSGVTSRVPFAAEFPVEARMDVRLTRWLAIAAFARLAWTTAAARDNGVSVVDVGDELRAGVRVRVGKHYKHGRSLRGSDGYYVSAVVSESLGTRFVGAAFGYAIDFAFGR